MPGKLVVVILLGLLLFAVRVAIFQRTTTPASSTDAAVVTPEGKSQDVFSSDNPLYGEPRSSKWRSVRNQWVNQNPSCAICGETANPHVHHVQPFAQFPELELDPTNLETLCGPMANNCHLHWGHDPDGRYGPESASWSKYNPELRKHIRMYGVK